MATIPVKESGAAKCVWRPVCHSSITDGYFSDIWLVVIQVMTIPGKESGAAKCVWRPVCHSSITDGYFSDIWLVVFRW